MGYDPELWKKLQLGDRVRVVHMPNVPHPEPDETLALYAWLLRTGHVMRVMELHFFEGQSYPCSDWIVLQDGDLGIEEEESADGLHYHFLMLNHDGPERVD